MPQIVYYTSADQLASDYSALGLVPLLFLAVMVIIHHITRGKGGD